MTASGLDTPRPAKTAAGQDRRVSEDSVADYLHQIGRTPLLTRQQEVALAQAIEAGLFARAALETGSSPADHDDLRTLVALGEEARQSLIRANLRLVVSMAKRYLGQGLSMLDLVQEGNLGLMRAVERFDHELGFKFSTYGVWWIKQSITRAIADQGRTIRMPVHVAGDVYRAGRQQRLLSQQLGRLPTVAEVAADLNVSTQRAQDLLGWATEPTSLDIAVGDGDGVLADLVSDADGNLALERVVEGFVHADLAAALAKLTERERALLTLRFGLRDTRPHTLQELAAHFGVSRERVRQLQTRAMAKLRAGSQSETLHSYLR
ncbi:MAG TPA: sigma-70 family RNA polymerase sigma factor [Nocardioidaceae bacterium]|nr:sigma-70 family RNA polymerase sigma factor [Nocardioidaceae bacterium]